MAKVKNILSQIFFPKRLESSSHESYSGSCGDHAQWSLNPENGELRITGTGPLYDFFGEKEVPWESHLNHIRKVVVAHYSLNIFSEIPFYELSLYIRYLQMFSFDLNTHEISLF